MNSRKGSVSRRRKGRAASVLAICAGLLVCAGVSGAGAASPAKKTAAEDDGGPRLVVPMLDPEKGERLFVTKGCVICHSVNKVGGAAGPALDAPEGGRYLDLTDFMARMWRGAFAMIDLQGMELGYQLDFTGEELGNIAAFLSDSAMQKKFTEHDVPDLIRDMFIREPYDMGEGLKMPGQK